MTVSSTVSKSGPYAGAGTTGPFTVGFRFLDNSHLQVVRTDLNGVDSTLVLGTDYSVTGAGGDTGTVTLVTALATGYKLTIVRNVPATQEADYVENDSFPAESHETALDKLTMLVQQNGEAISRSIKVGVSDAPLADLPGPTSRANTVIGFDALGNVTTLPLPSSLGAGDRIPFTLVAGVDFVAGVSTTITLPRAPGSQGNLELFFDPMFQGFDQWTVNGLVVTFGTPIPVGVTKIFGYVGTTLSTQIPPDGSVDAGKIVWNGIINRVVDSIAALRALDRTKYDRAFVISYYPGEAKGGGAYWKKYDTAPGGYDNGGSQITAADGAGWELQFQDVLHGDQFGIRADNTGDESGTIQAAIVAMHNAGGGYVDLPVGNIRLTNQFLLYPNVYLRGQGRGRTYLQWQGANGITVMRTTQLTPGILSLGGGVSDLTINGQNTANGITGIDLSDAQAWKIRSVEFANLIYGLHFNKYATASGSPFGGQAYFNYVEQNEFVQCTSCVVFGGAANRNTFNTNTLRSSTVAYDFGVGTNFSETNVFINENVEGCHAWAEWSGVLANIYSQTWIGLTVENPTSNGYVCTMKDPGRQNFIGLTIIPANNPAAVDFFNLFTDGAGKAIRSDIFGTRGSSAGYSGYGNRSYEDLHFLGDTTTGGSSVRTRLFGESAVLTNTITAGNFLQVNFAVPGARIGDAIAWSISTLYPTLTISGPAVAANDVVSFSLYNTSASPITLNAKMYAAVAARPTTI